MPFTFNDPFDDFAREHSLPDCAVSFLSKAGLWSARASKSGFVPSTMHAGFSGDSDQAVRALLAAGAVRRVKAGVRIAESPCWTLVDARDVHRDIEREKAEAEERREKWKADKQRQRAAKKAEQPERIAAGVPGMSTGTSTDVHPENPLVSENPQVNGNGVQVDIPKTSTGTTKKTASDYQDQNQSSGVGQSNVRAREEPSTETVALVVAGCSKKLGKIVAEAEARYAIAEWDRRAEAAGEVIHDPAKYYPTCIRRERDLELIFAPPLPGAPSEWLELGQEPEPPPGAHVFVPSGAAFDNSSCMHPGCVVAEANKIHIRGAKTG